jgi:hypothetical protein
MVFSGRTTRKKRQNLKIPGGFPMRKQTIFTLFSFLFIVIVIGRVVIVAQAPITGTWTANSRDDKDGKINLSLERRSTNGNGRNQMGKSYDYSELQGLSPNPNGKVSFRLAKEAGNIDFQGEFVNGRGSGTFTYTPNPAFFDAMRSRGFDFSKSSSKRGGDDDVSDRMFAAATLGVTTALADDLLSADFGRLDVDDLFKAAIFNIDGRFLAEMKSTGFPNLGMEDLVKARIFKIDADYVRQVHEMGFDKEDFEGLVKFRIFKVTPEFLTSLKNEGFNDLSAEEVVKFRIFNIDPDFIRKAKAENPNVTVEQMVQMKIGVYRRGDY